MNNCEIIKDLLPLYVDDVMSNESKLLVENHLASCEKCKNECISIQSEVKRNNTTDPTNNEKINLFKSMKAKIFRQKIMVAMTAIALTVAIAFAGNWFIFHNARPIAFSPWTMRVELQNIESYWEGVASPATVLRLISSENFYGSHAITRRVNVDGVDTEVIFVYITETLSTRWSRNHNMHTQFVHLTGISEGVPYGLDSPIAVEIYYLIAPFRNSVWMDNDEFYALRHDGILLWSGVLAP